MFSSWANYVWVCSYASTYSSSTYIYILSTLTNYIIILRELSNQYWHWYVCPVHSNNQIFAATILTRSRSNYLSLKGYNNNLVFISNSCSLCQTLISFFCVYSDLVYIVIWDCLYLKHNIIHFGLFVYTTWMLYRFTDPYVKAKLINTDKELYFYIYFAIETYLYYNMCQIENIRHKNCKIEVKLFA